jgi:hypothetical protein
MLSSRHQSERGAILIHVAVASVVLIAFTMFIVDYGILWLSRNQAQNSADAGALAAATALAFDDEDNFAADGPARLAARGFALENDVFLEDPDVDIDGDIRFSQEAFDETVFPAECETENCVRVDVFRNQDRANPLPVWFGQLVGLVDQGVRAMAIARAGYGSFTNRTRPWGLPDRWNERCDPDGEWGFHADPDDCGTDPDVYQSCVNDAEGCTGYTPARDEGEAFILKNANPHDAIRPGHFNPVVLTSSTRGGSEYRDAIEFGGDVTIGDWIDIEPGNMIGPTGQGMDALTAQDPDAIWSTTLECVIRPPGNTCVDSPRIVCIPVFDPGLYFAAGGGRREVLVTNLLGMFVQPQGSNPPPGTDFINDDEDTLDNRDVWGWLTYCPGDEGGPTPNPGPSSFIRFIRLVR